MAGIYWIKAKKFDTRKTIWLGTKEHTKPPLLGRISHSLSLGEKFQSVAEVSVVFKHWLVLSVVVEGNAHVLRVTAHVDYLTNKTASLGLSFGTKQRRATRHPTTPSFKHESLEKTCHASSGN